MITNPNATDLPRERWDTWDPMLISEGLFSAANIFSSLKLVYIFSVNPHLGPLQVSLSRMVMDIMKFFFLYVLVLFAFGSGLNQLLWFVKRKLKVYHGKKKVFILFFYFLKVLRGFGEETLSRSFPHQCFT